MTVDGRDPTNQLRMVVCSIIYTVLYTQGSFLAGFLNHPTGSENPIFATQVPVENPGALRIHALALASTSAGKKTTAKYRKMVTPKPIQGKTLDIL